MKKQSSQLGWGHSYLQASKSKGEVSHMHVQVLNCTHTRVEPGSVLLEDLEESFLIRNHFGEQISLVGSTVKTRASRDEQDKRFFLDFRWLLKP